MHKGEFTAQELDAPDPVTALRMVAPVLSFKRGRRTVTREPVRRQAVMRTVGHCDVEKRRRPAHGSVMKCRTVSSIAALCALTACQSPAGLAQKAPAWTATYQVPYDIMANCLIERERLPWVTVTPSIYPPERRATVTVTAPTGSALGVYDIHQISARATDVSYRSIYGGPGSGAGGDALEKANRCGNPT